MPGGLSSWLDDDTKANTINKRNSSSSNRGNTTNNPLTTRAVPRSVQAQPNRQPLTAVKGTRALEISIIDVDAENPSDNDEEKTRVLGKSTPSDTPNEPRSSCSSNSAGDDKRPDAFARLLQGSALSAAAHSSPDTPASRTPDQGMAWGRFPDSGGDGKENRENAFSRMLASAGKKRKRPAGSWSSNGAVKAGMATRFCECPVCGKTVIIERCGEHLDKECDGPTTATTDASSPLSIGDSQTAGSNSISVESPPAATSPSPPAATPKYVAAPALLAGAGACESALPTLSSSPAASAACHPGEVGAPADNEGEARRNAGGADVASRASCVPLPVASRDADTGVGEPKRAACLTKKRSQRAATTTARDGAAALAAAPAVTTTCPVCAKHVRADLCSLHLDTNCAGVNVSPPPAEDGKVDGKVEGAKGKRLRQTERGGCSSSSAAEDAKAGCMEDRPGEDESEAAGGLTALAAELTCPICLCLFEDAHALPCSHRFCLDCIQGCFRSSKRQECPLCKVPAWKRDLKRDVPLQNILLAYRRMAI